jgi:hypothetical protein
VQISRSVSSCATPGQRQRIGAPLPFDRHGDLVFGDAVEFPGMIRGQRFDDVDGVNLIPQRQILGESHARVPQFAAVSG